MSIGKRSGLRVWVLGVATPGLMWQSVPAFGQTLNSPTTNQKKAIAGAPPVSAAQKQQRQVVQTAAQQANPIQQTSQLVAANTDNRSEVQKQLEALYQQDGREMPDLNFNLQPVPTQNTTQQQSPNAPSAQTPNASGTRPGTAVAPSSQKPSRAPQGHTQYQPPHAQSQATPYPAQPVQQPNRTAAATAQPPVQGQNRPNPVTSFFRKLNGTSNNKPLTTQAPVPPDYSQNAQGAQNGPTATPVFSQPPTQHAHYPAPSTPANQQNRPVTQTRMANTVPNTVPNMVPNTLSNKTTNGGAPAVAPRLNVQTTQSVGPAPQTTPLLQAAPTSVARPVVQLPPLADMPLPLQVAAVRVDAPKARVEPQSQLPVLSSITQQPDKVQQDKSQPAKLESSTEFPNPFPEVPESVADVKISSAQKSGQLASPKTDVVVTPKVDAGAPKALEPKTLEEDKKAESLSEPGTAVVVQTDEDPFAVDAKDFVEPLIRDADTSKPDPTAPSLDGAPALVSPIAEDEEPGTEPKPIDQPEAIETSEPLPSVNTEEARMEKMKRIRERFGMKGLKGFCPVSLRETRELIDARPEFFVTYRNQKFHFSSAETRNKFEANPFRYVPAVYGADVVALSRDKEDVVEGTLDFAAWYKGRLYLFNSQENYEAFIAEPVRYTTLDGIE